jgi:hypothetical protein
MFDFYAALFVVVAFIALLSAAMFGYYRYGRESVKKEEAINVSAIQKKREIEASKPIATRDTILERMRNGRF